MYNYNDIRHVHLEISTRCNAACPLCPRTENGVDLIDDYPIHDMTFTEARTIFTTDFLRQLQRININGNLGDFVTARDGLEIVQYFVDANPGLQIYISTNASAKPKIWSELGKLGVTVGFDIDGLGDTHALYRQYTDWDLVISNAQAFIAAGGCAHWRMIKFAHNEHQIAECERMSRELGFESFELIDHGRNHGPVFDREGNFSHELGKSQIPLEFKLVRDSREAHRQNVRENPIRFYRTLEVPKQINCWAKKNQSVYVTATGLVYPCCWTGFYPGIMFHEGNAQIFDLQQENNAIEFGIEHAVAWFSQVEEQWAKPDYESGSLYICNNICGKRN